MPQKKPAHISLLKHDDEVERVAYFKFTEEKEDNGHRIFWTREPRCGAEDERIKKLRTVNFFKMMTDNEKSEKKWDWLSGTIGVISGVAIILPWFLGADVLAITAKLIVSLIGILLMFLWIWLEKQWKERREQRIAEELVKYRKVLRKIPASGNRILNNRESAEVIYAEIMHALEFSCIEGCDYISAMIFTITFAEENNVAHPDTNAVTIANTLGFRSPETKREVLEMLERFYINGYYVLGSQEKHNALRVLIENNS